MEAIAYRYGSDKAFQALVTKVEALITAIKTVAQNALNTASSASSTASTANTNATKAQAMAQYHGTCSTAAGTAAKVVTCSEFTRNTGSRIAVKFSAANTAASPSLNVNGTGAAAIWQDGAAAASGCWKANETCLFEFDGTYWNLLKGKGGVSAWTDISGACPVSKGGTGATSAAAALAALGGAKMALYNATVGTGWSTNSSGGYKITVSVSGITANDVPVVGVKMSDDVSAATNQGKAFACINRITTAANSITCYAFTTKPTTSISIQLLVVRNA